MLRRDTGQLDRLVRKATSLLGQELEALMSVVDKRTLSKLISIKLLDNLIYVWIIKVSVCLSVYLSRGGKERSVTFIVAMLSFTVRSWLRMVACLFVRPVIWYLQVVPRLVMFYAFISSPC